MKRLLAILLAVAGTALAQEPLGDPMRPPSSGAGEHKTNLVPTRVSAVFTSAERRSAIVDGVLVKAGERAGLCLVEEILDDGVRCRFPKGTRVVRLPNVAPAFKKSASAAETGAP